MKNERVFISGGAGVIGTELTRILVQLGAEVFVGDLKKRPKDLSEKVRYRQGDLNHISHAEIEGFSPTIFIHLAATFERSTENYDFWEKNFWNNVRLSHHLMDIFKDTPTLRKVLFASSYLIYDPSKYIFKKPALTPTFLSESTPIAPRNLTGMAKLAHEIELNFLNGFKSAQFTSVCARIFRGYGCNSRDVISRWIRSALREEKITVFRPEGMFDYIYAKDTAFALVRLAQTPDINGIINLGTGKSRRVSDVVDILQRRFQNLEVDLIDDIDMDYEASCADMSLFKEKIAGWEPAYTLESAISEIIEFEKSQLICEQKKQNGNILISSASRKIPLIKSILEAKDRFDKEILVYAGDINKDAHAQFVCDGLILLPATSVENFEEILNLLKENQIELVIPTRDGELEFWATHRKALEKEGIQVIVSEPEAITTSLDKLAFAKFGEIKGFPIIPAWEHPQGKGPFVVKERYGAGSRSIGLNIETLDAALEWGAKLAQPIYQPFIEGKEISVDAWLDKTSKVKGLVLRERNQVAQGESVVTTTFRDTRLEAQCTQLLEALPLHGPVVLQVIIDSLGNPHIIELNARFGGASTASVAVGLDIWYWTLLEWDNQNLDLVPYLRSDKEARQIRVPQDILLYDSSF
ncbi:NAD-dependent epimerase/dehydratase family protein [Allopseudospirillum japonicum]|nr:NAD-dependent epimerase/dehydratase family protein [Allopseudospirillum japonicum]